MAFTKAVRSQKRLRFGGAGLPGGGKTFSFLRLAHLIAHRMGKGKVAVIDSEEGSASLYQGMTEDGITWDFDTQILKDFSPVTYTTFIKEAGKAGYDCLIVDGLTQAWQGEGGALDLHQQATSRTPGNNSYFAWREISPLHNALVDALLRSPCHVFASLRVKMDYVVETVNGKQVPRKIGLKPIQREGMEYEFDLFGEFNDDENPVMTITKSRCFQIKKGTKYLKPGPEVAEPLIGWLSSGAPLPPGEAPELTIFDQFYRRLLAASTLAEVSLIGREVKDAQGKMKPSEYETLVSKAAAVKGDLPAGSVAATVPADVPKTAASEPVTVAPPVLKPAVAALTVPLNGSQAASPPASEAESLKFMLMKQKVADAKTPGDILAVGKEASALRSELAAGEFEKLVALGKQRKEIITAAAAGKSAPAA